jgi:hypothetical protein
MAKGAQFGVVDEILSENEKNYAILHSEITQRRVKLPRVLHRGTVTLTTAQGEEVFRLQSLLEGPHDKNYYAKRVFLGRIAEQYLLKKGFKLNAIQNIRMVLPL